MKYIITIQDRTNLIGPVCMRPGRSQSGRSRFGDTCSIIYNKFLHDTGMENAQTSLKSSRPMDLADYLQSGRIESAKKVNTNTFQTGLSCAFSASEQWMLDKALAVKNNNGKSKDL